MLKFLSRTETIDLLRIAWCSDLCRLMSTTDLISNAWFTGQQQLSSAWWSFKESYSAYIAKYNCWYYVSQLCYIGSFHTTGALNTYTFAPTAISLLYKEKKALKSPNNIFHTIKPSRMQCELVCDWLTRHQSTGFMAVWQGRPVPNLRLFMASKLCHTGKHSNEPFLEMTWSCLLNPIRLYCSCSDTRATPVCSRFVVPFMWCMFCVEHCGLGEPFRKACSSS